MAPPRATAAFKKQNGIIAISKDRKAVSWTPSQPPDASPVVIISASDITNLQQTPESNPKVSLKIWAQVKGQTEPVSYIFSFTSMSEARAEANAIKDALSTVIQAQKAVQIGAIDSGTGSSAALSIANAVSAGGRTGNLWEDDDRLKIDVALQQSLMREDPALQKTFLEARSLKPDSISNTSFTAQFWSSRVHLLRAHAIAKNQNRGTYNVFSTLRREEGGSKMSLSQEHVHLIFSQYPLMRRIYDEVVPKRLNEVEFWSRFFQSMIYMKLRGLKIDRKTDNQDTVLDKYLDAPELTGLRSTSQELHIPRVIDMEGNEENHPQRKGNRPDTELRPQSHDKVPIIRTLNALSEKLMAQVIPSDFDPAAPIGMDEATYENLRLRDLAGDPEQNRIILKIRDQSRFFSDGRAEVSDAQMSKARHIDPVEAIKEVCADIAKSFPEPGSGALQVEFDDSEDDEDETDAPKTASASVQATSHIMDLVRQHRGQTEEVPTSSGLSPGVYDRLILTHATASEFLHQFWSAFLSGDPSRVGEVSSLMESLNRAMDRINAVADTAEEERRSVIQKWQEASDRNFKITGKRQKIDFKTIGGGKDVVRQLLGPITNALANATARYRKALAEQTVDG